MDQEQISMVIRRIREQKGMTQEMLANRIGVSDKTVSKWETGKGLPDIGSMEPLAQALGMSVMELFQGQENQNRNIAGNMLRSKLYICPQCGNVIHGMGEASVSCCGRSLVPANAQEAVDKHRAYIEPVEDELFVVWDHEMSKEHYISFVMLAQDNEFIFQKLYPEGSAELRLPRRRRGFLYFYCTNHGLFCQRL